MFDAARLQRADKLKHVTRRATDERGQVRHVVDLALRDKVDPIGQTSHRLHFPHSQLLDLLPTRAASAPVHQPGDEVVGAQRERDGGSNIRLECENGASALGVCGVASVWLRGRDERHVQFGPRNSGGHVRCCGASLCRRLERLLK
eukprot:scaffold4779_cov116-Isochrysis_galbana.AAC.9